MTPEQFAREVLAWYDRHGRHDLPWQRPRTVYRVWVSEVMLQQTQVATVIPYFERFMRRFPDVNALAEAQEDEVLHQWTGLGYYARARNLHRAARRIRDQYGGEFPLDFDAVNALPGIGRSTAAAILAQADDQHHAILDGNVKRVLTRFHAIAGWPGERAVEQELWQLAERYTPRDRCADYTQAIMDLGATVCRRGTPACDACPIVRACRAHARGEVRQYPGPRPRRELPVRSTVMLLLTDPAGQVLLQRRPATGLWGGLWSLPECPPDSDVQSWCTERLGLRVQDARDWPSLRHTFSHFHLDIRPVHALALPHDGRVMEPTGLVWYNTRRPDARGLPAPVDRLLEALRKQGTK